MLVFHRRFPGVNSAGESKKFSFAEHFSVLKKGSNNMSTTVQVVFGIILTVFAVFLVVAVLMQEGKSYGLSGAISGGADTIFGKTRGKKLSSILSKATTVIGIIFAVLVILLTTINRVEFEPNLDNVNATPSADEETTTEATSEEPATETETVAASTADEAVSTTQAEA